MVNNDLLALLVTFLLALAWLRINDFAAQRGWISSRLSRKIIHIGTGPLFVLCWPLFTDAPSARWLAALIPLAITLQFLLVGLGLIRDEASVAAMARTGDRREILRGPLYYGIIFVALTLVFWRSSPVGISALMVLCGGDGLAEVTGRKFGRLRLPWNRNKSWAGSLGMFLGSFLLAAPVLALFIWLGYIQTGLALPASLLRLALIALGAALVETLPLEDVDNITITLTAIVLGLWFFK